VSEIRNDDGPDLGIEAATVKEEHEEVLTPDGTSSKVDKPGLSTAFDRRGDQEESTRPGCELLSRAGP
jgi:hypothetical protein